VSSFPAAPYVFLPAAAKTLSDLPAADPAPDFVFSTTDFFISAPFFLKTDQAVFYFINSV